MKFGELCRNRRETLGMKQKEVAEKVGCKPEYISSIENGVRYPGLGTSLKLAEVLGINDSKRFYLECMKEQVPDDFKHIYDMPSEKEVAKLREAERAGKKGRRPNADTVEIDDLGSEYQKVLYFDTEALKTAAVDGFNLDNARISKYPVVLFPGKGAPNCFAVSVDNDSMEPAVKKEDVVVICLGEVPAGQIGLFQIDNKIVLKRLGGIDEEHIVLTSENQAKYPPIFKAKDDVHIIGRMIGIVWREFK